MTHIPEFIRVQLCQCQTMQVECGEEKLVPFVTKCTFEASDLILGVGKFTPVAALMGETSWDTPTV